MSAVALYARLTPGYDQRVTETVALLQDAAVRHPRRIVLTTSLGAEDTVLADLIARHHLPISLATLQTGRLPPETLGLIPQLELRYGLNVEIWQPEPAAALKFTTRHGALPMRQSIELRKACCALRKLEPLSRALVGRTAWVTGLRREQSDARAELPVSSVDEHDREKLNPLAAWSQADVWHFIRCHAVPCGALQPAARPIFPQSGLCPLHTRRGRGRGHPRRTLVVGTRRRQGVRPAYEQRRLLGIRQGDRMNAPAYIEQLLPGLDQQHLDGLEEEPIFILREVAASFERPALLFSGGKDSCVVLRLAEKAFKQCTSSPSPGNPFAGRLPFPLLHVDTGHNFPEVMAFRDQRVAETGERLLVGSVEAGMRRGTVRLAHALESRNGHQTVALLEAIEEHRFDCLIGGARRDEEKARAKERIFSHRDSFGQWQPKEQRPKLWTLFNTRIKPGEHFRTFPISNWTELDVWLYIARENIPLPGLYFRHVREVVRRKGLLVPVTPVTPPAAGEVVETVRVRFRTVGDMTCTCPVESEAGTAAEIVAETLTVTVSERGATRIDDRASDSAMERRKK